MAESSWPGAGPATVDEAMWEALAEPYWQSGLIGSPLDSPPVYADSTGMQVKVRAGTRAIVRGHVWDAGDSDIALSIDANAAGSTRVDLVVLRLDRSSWNVTATVVKGTAGSGVPAISTDTGNTGAWDLVIGRVEVPAGESTSIAPTMVRSFTMYLGPQLLVMDLGQPGMPSGVRPPFYLRYAPNEDALLLGRQGSEIAVYRDSGWVSLGGANTGWSATQTSYVRRIGSIVTLRLGNLQRTGGALAANADSRLFAGTLPANFRWTGSGEVDFVVLVGNSPARITIYPTTGTRANQIWLTNHTGVSTGASVWGSTVTWMV